MFDAMLQELTMAYGPSGREDRVAEVIASYLRPWADEIRRDAIGSLIARKKGRSGKKLMFAAHMDQIGLVVTGKDEKGFLRAANVGGVNPVTAVARRVVFENGVSGVVFYETEEKKPGEVDFPQLFIDVGGQAQDVSVGDMAVFTSELCLEGDHITGGALDNRLSCAALMEAALTGTSEHELYLVFTAQEEVGTRGAGAAAYGILPDLAVAVDITKTGDTPKAALQSVALGKGPAIKVMDSSVVVNPTVRRFLTRCAKEAGIAVQNEVLTAGGTDTGAIQRTAGGLLAGCISIPVRYVHTPVETAGRQDVVDTVALLRAVMAADLSEFGGQHG